MERSALVTLIGATRNIWMMGFAVTSHHLSKAIVAGAITDEEILAFPLHEYPEDLCRALAAKAGLGFHDDEKALPGGMPFGVEVEDVDITVTALRDVIAGNVSVEGPGWSFYEEDLTEYTLDDISAALKLHTTITQAAQLIVDADAEWLARATHNR